MNITLFAHLIFQLGNLSKEFGGEYDLTNNFIPMDEFDDRNPEEEDMVDQFSAEDKELIPWLEKNEDLSLGPFPFTVEPDGYLRYTEETGNAAGVGLYKLHMNPAQWLIAEDACEFEGARLTVIETAFEAGIIRRIFLEWWLNAEDADEYDMWIGYDDREEEGEWVTITGKPVTEFYTHWTRGEPNNSGDAEDCCTIKLSGFMNDINCSWKRIFMCEKPLPGPEARGNPESTVPEDDNDVDSLFQDLK